MELLTANLRPATVKLVISNDRRYLVAPLTLIVPGVLPGSKGPLYYPPEEVGRDPEKWNHIPIVVNHPTDWQGNSLSARDPEVAERYKVGYVYRTIFNGRLKAEAWIDEDLADRIDPRVTRNLKAGIPMEVSTGLHTYNIPAENGASHKGRGYIAVARDYRPDHLAILPEAKGACSLEDGCGLLVHITSSSSELKSNADLEDEFETLGAAFALNEDSAKTAKKCGCKNHSKCECKKLMWENIDNISRSKACKILHDKKANGKPLTDRQRRFMGAKCHPSN